MKRFLSLVLSALFVFQLGNTSCDAGSQWDKRKFIRADVNLNAVQPQVFTVPVSQQQPIINVTAPEQPAPVVNVTPTPQNITVQSPAVNIKKVDATTVGEKIVGWLKCALWVLLVGGTSFLGYKLWSSGWSSLRENILSKSNEIFESVGGKIAESLDFMFGTNGTIKASFDGTMDVAKNMMTEEELKEFETSLKDDKGGSDNNRKSWYCSWFSC